MRPTTRHNAASLALGWCGTVDGVGGQGRVGFVEIEDDLGEGWSWVKKSRMRPTTPRFHAALLALGWCRTVDGVGGQGQVGFVEIEDDLGGGMELGRKN